MKTSFLRIALPVLIWTLSFSSKTVASPIVVGNPSFETAGGGGLPFLCGTACSYSTDGVIPGWTVTGPAGLFRPGPPINTTYFNSVTDGTTTAYSDGGSISQTVGATVQLGVTYSLQVNVGVRNDIGVDLGTEALVINGNTILATGVLPTAGNWSTFTATYTGLAADVGQAITIRLASAGVEGNWDIVRLSDNVTSTTPEPATGALVSLMVLAWAGIARRKASDKR
jgi:hypothetical protein